MLKRADVPQYFTSKNKIQYCAQIDKKDLAFRQFVLAFHRLNVIILLFSYCF